jgi:hypothetical protein
MDTTTPSSVINIAGIIMLCVFLAFAVLFLRKFVKDINQGRGPMGSTIQQTRALTRENIEVAKECLQTERELLATQKEMNELLKGIIARLEKQP